MINEEYHSQVKIIDERDSFIGVTSAGVKFLIKAVESNVDQHFMSMSRLSWASWENVGDQNAYITSIGTALLSTAKIIRKNLSGVKYYKMYCEKFTGKLLPFDKVTSIEIFLTKFLSNVFKCKGVSSVGAEQLLLDTQALRSVIMQMSTVGSEPGTQPTQLYL